MERITTVLIANRDANGNIQILESKTTVEPINSVPVTVEHLLRKSDVQYGILILGAKNPLEQFLTPGSPVRFEYKGKEYTGSVHLATKGRIDGLTQLIKGFEEFYIGAAINITYDPLSSLFRVTTK